MNTSNNKKIAKNTFILYLRMIFLMCISFYTSRVILDKLGVEDYGIYNVVGGVVSMFSFISGPMIESTQRFLNFSLGENDLEKTNKVFNASVIIHFVIAIFIVILLESVGMWFFSNKLVIPTDRYNAAFWTFQLSIFTSFFLLMSYPYNAVIISREKMGAFAAISIYEGLMKLIIAYVITVTRWDKLIFYAILIMFLQISVSLTYRFYCIRHFEESKFEPLCVEKDLLKEMIGFSGWNFLGNIANVCLTQGVNMLLNIFFGPVVNAARAVAVHVQNSVGQLCNNFQMAFKPQIVKNYANGDLDEMHTLMFNASRYSYLLTFLGALPLLMMSEFILSIWLKQTPDYSSDFVCYTMCFILIRALATPLLTGALATGNIKEIMIVLPAIFVSVIPISYLFLLQGFSPLVVFQIQLGLYIIAHFVRVRMVSKQLNFSKSKYCRSVILPIAEVTLVSVCVSYLLKYLTSDSTLENIVLLCVICILNVVSILFVGLTKDERVGLLDVVRKKIKR